MEIDSYTMKNIKELSSGNLILTPACFVFVINNHYTISNSNSYSEFEILANTSDNNQSILIDNFNLYRNTWKLLYV